MGRQGLMDDAGWDYVSCENTDWQEKCRGCVMTECQVYQDKLAERFTECLRCKHLMICEDEDLAQEDADFNCENFEVDDEYEGGSKWQSK